MRFTQSGEPAERRLSLAAGLQLVTGGLCTLLTAVTTLAQRLCTHRGDDTLAQCPYTSTHRGDDTRSGSL